MASFVKHGLLSRARKKVSLSRNEGPPCDLLLLGTLLTLLSCLQFFRPEPFPYLQNQEHTGPSGPLTTGPNTSPTNLQGQLDGCIYRKEK